MGLGLLIVLLNEKELSGMHWGNVVGAVKKNVFAEALKIRSGKMRKSWWTITFYKNDVTEWVGRSSYDSTIHVNNVDDKVIDRESAYKYAKLIRGDRNLWFSVERGKIR